MLSSLTSSADEVFALAAYRARAQSAEAALLKAREVLEEIANPRPEPVDHYRQEHVVQGPAILWAWAQRRAAQVLSELEGVTGSANASRAATGPLPRIAPEAEPSAPFQARVEPWMRECFGDVIPFDKVERGDRLLEEVFELLQSGAYDPARVLALRDYVWGRDIGEPTQEAGGVMITMAAYSLAFGLDMHQAGETELARVWTKVDAIRAKQAAKPTGSALPIPVAAVSPEGGSTGAPEEPIPTGLTPSEGDE